MAFSAPTSLAFSSWGQLCHRGDGIQAAHQHAGGGGRPRLGGGARAPVLRLLGYEHRGDSGARGWIRLAKSLRSRRTHHLSLAESTGEYWRRTTLFRDHLRTHPEVAREYPDLKREFARCTPRITSLTRRARTASSLARPNGQLVWPPPASPPHCRVPLCRLSSKRR